MNAERIAQIAHKNNGRDPVIDELLAAVIPDDGFTLAHLQRINVIRALRWHGGVMDWSPLEWCGAMAGEVGEACNAAKKLKRIEGQLQNNDGRLFGQSLSLPEQREKYKLMVGKEVADAIIYGVLTAHHVGANIEDCVRDVFNTKSEEYGFPERL